MCGVDFIFVSSASLWLHFVDDFVHTIIIIIWNNNKIQWIIIKHWINLSKSSYSELCRANKDTRLTIFHKIIGVLSLFNGQHCVWSIRPFSCAPSDSNNVTVGYFIPHPKWYRIDLHGFWMRKQPIHETEKWVTCMRSHLSFVMTLVDRCCFFP